MTARGATYHTLCGYYFDFVSIHAPARGPTCAARESLFLTPLFQYLACTGQKDDGEVSEGINKPVL